MYQNKNNQFVIEEEKHEHNNSNSNRSSDEENYMLSKQSVGKQSKSGGQKQSYKMNSYNNSNNAIRRNNKSKLTNNDYNVGESNVSPHGSASYIPPLGPQANEVKRANNNMSENSNPGSNAGSQVRGRHLISQGGNSSNGGQFNNKSSHNLMTHHMPYQDNHHVQSSNSHGGAGFNQQNFSMQKVPSKIGHMHQQPPSSSGAAAVALPNQIGSSKRNVVGPNFQNS
jgi:hypothetical protein